jgi:hypothetical protein
MSKEEQKSMLDKAEKWVSTVVDLGGKELINDPASYAQSFGSSFFKKKIAAVKESMVEKHLFLYLVDEFTGKPVYDEGGVYPVRIETKSEHVDKCVRERSAFTSSLLTRLRRYLPMMRLGLQAAAVANGAVSIANIFCPCVPRMLVPPTLLAKATSFVDGLGKPSNVADHSSVQKHVEDGDEGGGAKRGGELRDFEKFLRTHDPESSYAGLMRVCNEEDGTAIWVSEDSAKDIESGRGDAAKDMEAEISMLRAQVASGGGGGGDTGRRDAVEEPAGEGPNEASVVAALRAEIKALKAMKAEPSVAQKGTSNLTDALAEIDTAVSRLKELSAKAAMASVVRTGTLLKQSMYRKSWEKRAVTLDPFGNLRVDGGAGHQGFVTLREGDRVVPINALDFTVEAEGRKFPFRAGNVTEAGQWVEWIREFVGDGGEQFPPPPPGSI